MPICTAEDMAHLVIQNGPVPEMSKNCSIARGTFQTITNAHNIIMMLTLVYHAVCIVSAAAMGFFLQLLELAFDYTC